MNGQQQETREERLIARRWPGHADATEEWDFIRLSVEGGKAYAEANLYKHPREEGEVFTNRLIRSRDNRQNLTKLVLDAFEGFIFQNEPKAAEKLPAEIVDFLGCATQDGDKAISLAKATSYWMTGYGVIWMAVDKPQAPEVPEGQSVLTAAQEAELGLKPYAYLMHPQNVLDGKLAKGVPVWLLVREDERDDADPWASSGEMKERYRLWTSESVTLLEPIRNKETGKIESIAVTETPNELGEVPFVAFRYAEGSGFSCPGLVGDVAHLDKAIFNKQSLLDEIHYALTFPQLCVPFAGTLYDAGGLTPEGESILTMGLHSVLPYHSNSGAPTLLESSGASAGILEGWIAQAVQQALALALLDGEVAQEGETTAAASGVSKAYTFEKLNRRLSAIADALEKGFRRVFRLVMLWQAKNPDALPATIWDFPDNFEVKSLRQEVLEAMELAGLNIPSAQFKALILKGIVRKTFPKLDPADLEVIDQEIEDGILAEAVASAAAREMLLGQGNQGDHQDNQDDPQAGDDQGGVQKDPKDNLDGGGE